MPDDILKEFPRTRISAAEQDPFRDPILDLVVRMKKLGLDVKLIMMKDYIHGSHSFVYQNGVGIEEYMVGTQNATDTFK